MRPDRRHLVAGGALGIVLLFLDPLGVRQRALAWFAVARPAEGSTREMAAAVVERSARVDDLADALAADPALSLALLGAGVGAGLVAGSTAAYLRERGRLRRGERGG